MKVISNKNAKIFGDSCGKHGTYTFYPGLQFTAHNQTHYLTLGKFFYALLNFPSPCGAAPKSLKAVGELQLVWHDKNHQDGDLCSVKFYIKPEDCPDGRQPHHGQDEVVAEENKVVLMLSELVELILIDQPCEHHHHHHHHQHHYQHHQQSPSNAINTTSCDNDTKANNKSTNEKIHMHVNTGNNIKESNSALNANNNYNTNNEFDGQPVKSEANFNIACDPGAGHPQPSVGDHSLDCRNENLLRVNTDNAKNNVNVPASNNCKSSSDFNLNTNAAPKEATDASGIHGPLHYHHLKKPIIISYPQYCRYQCARKRLTMISRQDDLQMLAYLLGKSFVQSLPSVVSDVDVFFCMDTAANPDFKSFKSELSHLAPRLKGRKRKKKNYSKYFESDDSNESEICLDQIVLRKTSNRFSNVSFDFAALTSPSPSKRKKLQSEGRIHKCKPDTAKNSTGTTCDKDAIASKNNSPVSNSLVNDKTVFLEKLYQFMNDNQSPISKNPILGFKEVDLHQFYVSTHKRGGYDQVTKKKLWKEIYMELGGSACNTSAATGTRKNYEKYLQPFENFMNNSTNASNKKCTKKTVKGKFQFNAAFVSATHGSEEDKFSASGESPTKTLMKLNFNKEPFIVIRPVCNNMLTSSATSLPVVSVIQDKTFIHSKFKKSTEAANATKVNNLSPKKINNQSDVNIIESSQLGEGLKNKIEVKEDLINVVEKDSLGLSMDHSISGVTKLSNKMSTGNTNSNLENTEMLQDDVIVVKEVINCATSHRIKLNGNNNTTSNTANIFPTDLFVGNPLPTSSLASCYTGESAFVLSKSEFSDLVATPLTPSLPTTMPLSFSVSSYNSLPTSTTTLTSSTTTTPMFPSLLNSTSVLRNQQMSTLLETSQIASEKGYTELVKSENSKAPKYSRLFPQNEEMILKKISASKTTNSTQLNANANELSSTWSNQFIKCTSISNDDDSPTDLSMKTMKKLEEESLLKMMLNLEQSEPLDLSKKVPKEEYNCGFATVSKDCQQQQQPLDLTKTPRQPDKDFKPNVTLPMNLTHLLPLAFAMPFSSNLQVSPRQILSPIQQNINMIYNPGSINFPILSFNPTSSCASVKP